MNGKDLRTIRTFHRLRQTQLAGLLGVGQTYIAMIEAGERPFTQDLQTRTMQALGLSPEDVAQIIEAQAKYDAARERLVKAK